MVHGAHDPEPGASYRRLINIAHSNLLFLGLLRDPNWPYPLISVRIRFPMLIGTQIDRGLIAEPSLREVQLLFP